MLTRALKTFTVIVIFSLLSGLSQVTFAETTGNFSVQIAETDPAVHSTIELEDKLYLKVVYESEIPLRFQAQGLLHGSALEVGAIKNHALLHPSGEGEALAWVMYLNTTHIDSVGVNVFNEKWEKLFQLTHDIDVTWQENTSVSERLLADWIKPLDRGEKRLTDFFYDPLPQRFGALYDIFFYINLAAIPVYILLQLHMLYRYRYRWRELALIPLFPYLIVGFYLLAGLDIDNALLITFVFRYTFVALLWLLILWLARRYWKDKLPPPKLYKPPES